MRPPSTSTTELAAVSPARFADVLMMALSLALGGGSIVLFAWPERPTLVDMGLSTGAALWWNGLLSFAFFLQHSVLVRRGIRARITAVIPARYDAAFYSITSGLVLGLAVVLYQPAGAPFLVLEGVRRAIAGGVALLAVAAFVWGVLALRTFDPFGLRPIRDHLRGAPAAREPRPAGVLTVRGPYRWVRHPLYSAIIVLLWASPAMSPGRLEFALLWTAWICVGAALEERDLGAEFGDTYRRYREHVPMLIPWRRPIAASRV